MLQSEQQGTETEPQPSSDPGGYSRMEPTDFERGFRAVGVLDTLKLTAEFLSSVRGRRKALLFFSEGIDYPITDSFGGHSASDVIRATQDAITAAARANVNFYTIDPRGLVGMTNEFMEMAGGGSPEMAGGAAMRTPGTNAAITGVMGNTGGPFNAQTELMAELMLSQGSLRELAAATGGVASVNTNSLTNTFNRIVQANSRYYRARLLPAAHIRAMAGSTRLTCARSGRACASLRERDTARRAAERRKNASAMKPRGSRAKRSGRTPTRPPRSCVKSSPVH